MKFRRTIKLGMSGPDVLYIKKQLFALGMYDSKIKRIISDKFRVDSVNATKNFQNTYDSINEGPLEVTGTIYEACWDAIEAAVRGEIKPKDDPTPSPEPTPEPTPTPTPTPSGLLDSYTWITPSKRKAIEQDLLETCEMRRNICLEILKYAFDPDLRAGNDVRALYMWGGNLYNTDLKLNIATAAKIKTAAKKDPKKYDGGREEWMLSEVAKNSNLPASDCSGMEVGWLRKFKLTKNTYDKNANTLGSTACSVQCSKEEAQPGTFAHRDGHLGTYVGGGYIVEFVGGAYGCQLTARDKRKVWNFVEGKTQTMSAWQDYWNFKELLKYDS